MRAPGLHYLLIALFGAASLTACAKVPPGQPAATKGLARNAGSTAEAKPVAGTPDARAIEAVHKIEPRAVVEQVSGAPVPGFREVIVAGQVAYVSDDGRYLFLPGAGGALYDTAKQSNLTEATLSKLRVKLLQSIPEADRIVFAPASPKHRVTVFTDISCGFCRKMHSEVAEYNRQGIAVEYLAFPRAGISSPDYQQMVSVWCATDRRKALTDAKNGRPVPPRTCKSPVDMQYDVGQRVGLSGTPMVIAADGRQLGGYVPPAKLRQLLDEGIAEPAEPAG